MGKSPTLKSFKNFKGKVKKTFLVKKGKRK